MSDVLEKLRKIRQSQDLKLKPSPYLKKTYIDEYGIEQPVHIRNYQASGIMNLCQVQRMCLGDDTGLGKTLEALSAVGYVWLKEPEYVPIIVTKKSSLFQWADEVDKFMKNMETITINGPPFKRHQLYEDFFLGHDPKKKRLLILTYEMLLRDIEETVIRDRETKPTKELKAQLRATRKALKEAEVQLEEAKIGFNAYFKDRGPETYEFIKSRLQPLEDGDEPKPPIDWTPKDENVLIGVIEIREQARELKIKLQELKDEEAPPKRVPGLIDYVRELLSLNEDAKIMFILDEIHVLKNHKGKMHGSAAKIAAVSDRVIGMTATPIKNRLMEFFGLFRIVYPKLFPKVTHFQNAFCVVKLQRIKGGRHVPIIVGYRNLDQFIQIIEPYYLSRKKHEVAKELPELVTRELTCILSDEQEELYAIAELGLLNTGEDPDSDAMNILSSLVMVQQAANAPELLSNEEGVPFEGTSTKMEVLIEQLKDELDGVKVMIFSRFEKMISLIEKRLKKEKIECVRITGKENAKERENSKKTYQNMKSGINVILITTAGSESLNLQSTEHIIMVDSPWSTGDYYQLIGRAVRIGSQHKVVIVTHLLARRKEGEKTIDQHVLKKLREKKKLMDKVTGEALPGGLEFVDKDMAMDLFNAIKFDHNTIQSVKKVRIQSTSSTSKRKSCKSKSKSKSINPIVDPKLIVDLSGI